MKVADYFEMERQAKEAAQSRRQQSRASIRDKEEAIIGQATERKEMALLAAGEISKSVLLSGTGKNRAEDRDREREAGKWSLGEPDAEAASVSEGEDLPDEIEDERNYAAPSMLGVLRQQREERWKGGGDSVHGKENRSE
jgi:hypothetical protein